MHHLNYWGGFLLHICANKLQLWLLQKINLLMGF